MNKDDFDYDKEKLEQIKLDLHYEALEDENLDLLQRRLEWEMFESMLIDLIDKKIEDLNKVKDKFQ